ncbi:MAG: FkbM family methyltransferase [Gemmatimonadetes bacterium]|nr:FkbM family methyltransferase [Gemmatimonadota bacterium]
MPTLLDATAGAFRWLPGFPGKGRVALVIHRLLKRGASDAMNLRTVRMRDGSLLEWDLRDESEARAFWLGTYDDALRDRLLGVVDPRGVLFDAGANVGAWTIPLARHVMRGGGRVVAFEPVPENVSRLKAALARNAWNSVVDVEPIALGDRDQSAWLWLKRVSTGASTGTAALLAVCEGDLRVPEVRLDSWIRAHALERLDFLKLDVEGAELRVLAGAERTIAKFRPLVLAELDEYWLSTHGQSHTDAARWAAARGYEPLYWCGGIQPGFRARRSGRTLATLFIPEERATTVRPALLPRPTLRFSAAAARTGSA